MTTLVNSHPTGATPVFVDTAGWADPVLQNTQAYQEMVAYYRSLLGSHRPIVTTNYVLNELVALLTTRALHVSRAEVVQYVNDILALKWLQVIHVNEGTHHEAWTLLEQSLDKEWSLVDASSFIVMRHGGITEAFTSDHHFLQAGFIRVPLNQ